MRPRFRAALVVVALVGVAALLVVGAMRIVERQRTADQINQLREELYRARVAADRCRGALQTSEASLRSLGSAIDSLRQIVDEYESIEGRGVPADEFEDYLVVFDAYNDSVGVWEGRERRLRAADAACRETILEHNALSDSLQAVLDEAGIEAV